jgi:3,4-dihydroxy 2-butanone 4-phosphate synthase / GTP cyclohydrolase II
MTQLNKKLNQAISALKSGQFVILTDDQDRENEGDLVIAAEFATPEKVNFILKSARGILCISLPEKTTQQIGLDLQPIRNRNKLCTHFTTSIDSRIGITTGVSAHDRAKTIADIIKPKASLDDFVTPGHLFPLLANPGGVLARPGHTEGSLDLMKLAALQPAAIICEIMNDDGTMAKGADLLAFSKRQNIPMLSIHELIQHQIIQGEGITALAKSTLPTKMHGPLCIRAYQSSTNHEEAIVLHSPNWTPTKGAPVRLHSACLTGDLFGSMRCDCGTQLDIALKHILANNGVLLYLAQEGRGIGLGNKIKAYALQDQGLDTVQANIALGFEADCRDYRLAAQILHHLRLTEICLMSNNPAKYQGLNDFGIHIKAKIPLNTPPCSHNQHYLQTKQHKLGHEIA